MLRKQNKLIATIKSIITLGLIGATLITAGCSSNNNSSTNNAPATTLSGVAATGVAMSGATVTVTDSKGASKTTTTGASGSYTLDVTGMTAPFVIVASGMAGDGAETLVSMVATQPTAGQAVVANVTPLTNALAATLDSTGDPLHMAANVATEAANITSTKLASATNNLQTALANLLGQVGASATTDFISGSFTANGSGLDNLLDSLQISVAPGGTANGGMTIAVKDGNGTVATSPLTLTATPAPLPALTTVADYTVANAAKAALTACFAVTPSVNRLTDSKCTGLVTADYLNNGRTGAQEFSFASGAEFDNAIAETPEIIRFIDAQHALVKLVLDQSSGQHYALTTIAEKSGLTNNIWLLRGNQRPYAMSINAVIDKHEELNANASIPSYYASGLNMRINASVGSAALVFANLGSYVKVTGPALPLAGIILKPIASPGVCPYLTITSETGDATVARKQSCNAFFRLTGIAQDPAKANAIDGLYLAGPSHNQNYSLGKISDTTLQGINPFEPYVFTVHDGAASTDTATTVFLRSRPLTLAELPNVRWNVLSAATKATMIPLNPAAFTGGASFPVSWTPQAMTAPVTGVSVQIRSGGVMISGNPAVAPSASSATVSPGVNFGSVATMGMTPSNLDLSYVNLPALTRTDLSIFSSTSYNTF